MCLSVAGKVTLVNLVIDNKLLQEEEYQKKYKASNISLLLGRDPSKNVGIALINTLAKVI